MTLMFTPKMFQEKEKESDDEEDTDVSSMLLL